MSSEAEERREGSREGQREKIKSIEVEEKEGRGEKSVEWHFRKEEISNGKKSEEPVM